MSEKMKSLYLIGLIYGFTGLLFFFVFHQATGFSLVIRLLIANIICTLCIYLLGILLKNSSLYDPYWSVIPPMITIGLSIYLNRFFEPIVLLLNVSLIIWSIRLTYNWAKLWKDFGHQDWRYTMIKQKYPKLWWMSNLFGIHLFPTFIVFLQLINAIYIIEHANQINIVTMIGFFMIVFATYIQWVSDRQMQAFKNSTYHNVSSVMNQGLWGFSRHPNYLGEIMIWFGVYVFYLSHVKQLNINIFFPMGMLLMFLIISIPMIEKKMCASKPDYISYQKDVSMLIPLPSKLNDILKKQSES